RLQQVAFAARQHARQHRTRGIHVRHHVHVPAALPLRVRRVLVAIDRDAGVRAEQIDPSVLLLHAHDEIDDVGLARDVGTPRAAADFARNLLGRGAVHVGDDDRLRALRRKPPAQRAADAVSASRDDGDLACEDHDALAAASPECIQAWRLATSFFTVRDAANSTTARNAARIGTMYIAVWSPSARNGSSARTLKPFDSPTRPRSSAAISAPHRSGATAPAAGARCNVEESATSPVPTGPMDAPSTYIAKKYNAIAVPRSDGSTTSWIVA